MLHIFKLSGESTPNCSTTKIHSHCCLDHPLPLAVDTQDNRTTDQIPSIEEEGAD
jgi:hypothetical protein